MNSATTVAYVPERGDFIWLDFESTSWHEQRGRRPALVLSPFEYHRRTGLAIVCPITSKTKGYPFEVEIPQSLEIHGAILSDHVRSVDFWERNAAFIAKADGSVIRKVSGMLALLVGE